jgi:hypothetical protein
MRSVSRTKGERLFSAAWEEEFGSRWADIMDIGTPAGRLAHDLAGRRLPASGIARGKPAAQG